MKLFIFVTIVGLVASHPADLVRQLIELHDGNTDTLRKDTENLIQSTETEMNLLRNLAQSSILQTLDKTNKNVNIILEYAISRSKSLTEYLTNEVKTASKIYPEDATTVCLSLIDYISGLPGSFQSRIELSLATAVRVGNATIRDDVSLMDNKFVLLDSLSKSLTGCGDDYDCVVKVSEEAVEYNTEFINSFNDVLVNIITVPQKIINQALNDVTNTVFVNEDYACNNADIMLNCLTSFDDEVDDTTTTSTKPTPTTNSGPTPAPTTAPTPTTPPTPTTSSPVIKSVWDDDTYCSHSPFNPDVNV